MTIFVESNDGFNPFSSCVEACPHSSHPQSSFQTHSPEIYPPDTTWKMENILQAWNIYVFLILCFRLKVF